MIERMNLLCQHEEPFLFVVDYNHEQGFVEKIAELPSTVLCSINGIELNTAYQGRACPTGQRIADLRLSPISFEKYSNAFAKALKEIKAGNSYLLNLTFPTELQGDIDLKSIYLQANAPYKMLFGNDFVFYSPESFIKIKDTKIYSFPMKGTIDARFEDAENTLLQNKKELYEHNTIVDLIRNDLAMVSRGVTVDRFRYVERVKTSKGEILQTSSQIHGTVSDDWRSNFGNLLFSLLPAGSISGAPKQKTLEIIADCEHSGRGFYTGVMGFFDGVNVDSCVIIRYIERKAEGSFYYRSGGGITALSNANEEYEELIKKVYVPII